jgi:hypothetical protein
VQEFPQGLYQLLSVLVLHVISRECIRDLYRISDQRKRRNFHKYFMTSNEHVSRNSLTKKIMASLINFLS